MQVFTLPAADLLTELTARQIRLEIEGEQLIAEGHLDDDLRQRIREHKAGLLALVKAGEHQWRHESHWHAQIEEAGGSRWLVFYSLDQPGKWHAHNLWTPREEDKK